MQTKDTQLPRDQQEYFFPDIMGSGVAMLDYDRDGRLDLLLLNGYYSAMAMVLNTAGMPLPDNAAPPLKPV